MSNIPEISHGKNFDAFAWSDQQEELWTRTWQVWKRNDVTNHPEPASKQGDDHERFEANS